MEASVSLVRMATGMGLIVCSISLQTNQSRVRELYLILKILASLVASLGEASVRNAPQVHLGMVKTV